jgi:hypothetical protein
MAASVFTAVIKIRDANDANPFIRVSAFASDGIKAGWGKPLPALVRINGKPLDAWPLQRSAGRSAPIDGSSARLRNVALPIEGVVGPQSQSVKPDAGICSDEVRVRVDSHNHDWRAQFRHREEALSEYGPT